MSYEASVWLLKQYTQTLRLYSVLILLKEPCVNLFVGPLFKGHRAQQVRL